MLACRTRWTCAKYMAMKEAITEMGRVSPVITVERQELRKQNTIRTVRMPPMIRVVSTSCTDSRIMTDASRTTWISNRPFGPTRRRL